ncbi:MAG: ABC transporter substrate-binding protein, partial [Ilumatobacteraceae bacterium]
SGTDDSGTDDSGTDDSGTDDSGTADSGDADAEPVSGGSLTYGVYGEASGFDPIQRGLGYCNTAIYDSLMRFDDEGNPEPYMAEGMESDDNVTWTLDLREGVEFHDGTPLDAEAVIYNIERHRVPENASPMFQQAQMIESMTAVDDYTVEFVLSQPFAVFPGMFAQSNGLGIIASPTALEERGEDYNSGPVGAGPFTFVEWIPDDHLTLTRNDNYWQEGLPYLDELNCRPLPDTQTRLQAMANGDVDLTYMITVAEIDQLKQEDGLVVHESVGNGGEGIVLNDTRPPFDDPRMREAFVAMLDLDVIADVRLAGRRELAGTVGLIAPDDPVYNPAKEEVWPEHDPDRARELVEEYRADGGDPNFTFKLPNTPDRRRFAEMASQFFGDVGLDVTMEFLDISEFVSGVLIPGDLQAAIMTYPSFVGQYPQMWNAYHTSGTSNWADFSDPDVDAALELAVSTTDAAEAEEAWKEVQLLVAEHIPFATYARSPAAIITVDGVEGVDRYPDNTLWFAELRTTE